MGIYTELDIVYQVYLSQTIGLLITFLGNYIYTFNRKSSKGIISAFNKYVITNDIPLDQRRAETEFELEFCLRKFSILQRERLNIEASMHPANRSPSQRSGALLFDDNGYPMPLNSSTTSKRVPKLPKPVRVRKGTKEQTTTKRGSPYLKAIRK